MNPFALYGIKEVADVTFWDIETGAPVLYLDTLKVSTIEETAEQAEATGGKGNAPLVIWDYGKEITLTLEDALFSMKSMQIMHGPNQGLATVSTVTRTSKATVTSNGQAPAWTSGGTYTNIAYYDGVNASAVAVANLSAGNTYIATWQETVSNGDKIVINAQTFPGTYKVTGTTYARRESDGKDEFFEFVIPKATIGAEQTITMQAEGDPSTFNMNLRVLRPSDGNMMELIKYPMA